MTHFRKWLPPIIFAVSVFFPVFLEAQDAPRWLTQKERIYPPETYIVAVGEGRTVDEARDRALMQISLYFNAVVQTQTALQDTYRETIQNGRSTSTHNTSFSESALIGSRADFFGVSFESPYTDRKKTVHVLAWINRAEAAAVYDSRIRDITTIVNNTLNANETSANPFVAVKKLRHARNLTELASGYADMSRLVNNNSTSQYAYIPTLISRLDRAVENNQKRTSVSITLNDERVRSLALKVAAILRDEGFLVTDSGGEYITTINVQLNEAVTQNYHTVRPIVDITLGLRNGNPLFRYQKEYALFRHITPGEALSRALRNIEQDVGGEFPAHLRGIGE